LSRSFAVSTSAVAREFRAADTQSEDYPTVQALNYMSRMIMERSGGRHQIKVFHSRQLGEEKETIEQTRAGAIDLNRTNVALIGTFVPAMNVLAMPFLFRSIEHLQKVLDGPIGNEILDSFEPYGFVGLAFYDSGARSIYNNVRPVRSIADIKGFPAFSVYAATKAAVRSFARSWTTDLKARGIRVNVVSPGPIDTPLLNGTFSNPDDMKVLASTIVMGRLGRPDELAKPVVVLASDDASFITSAELYVDGGAAQV